MIKLYWKENKILPIMACIIMVIMFFMCRNCFDGNIIFLFIISAMIVAVTIADYRCFKNKCIECQREYKEEKEFYNNITFDDLVNRLYADNEFDLDLMDGMS